MATITDGDAVVTIIEDPRILDIQFVANSDADVQFILITFTQTVDGVTTTFSQVVALTKEGQQIDFVFGFDVGADISTTDPFTVTFQYLGNADGTSDTINVTSLVVEGTTIESSSGNIQLGNQGAAKEIVGATITPTDLGGTVTADVETDLNVVNGTSSDDTINLATSPPSTNDSDIIDGGAGNDTINGGEGSDVLIGGLGDDILDGDDGVGIDTADYSGASSLDGNPEAVDGILADLSAGAIGSGTVTGLFDSDVGTDTLIEIENIIGTDFNDTLIGDDGKNFLSGLDGDDTITGNGGNDILSGGAGIDIITGGAGDDVLFGGDGNNSLSGGGGSDILFGGKDDDTFIFLKTDVGDGDDLVLEFDQGGGVDVLDISDVFDGTGGAGLSLAALDAGGWLDLDSLTDVVGGAAVDTVISVDTSGGGSFTTLVIVQDVTLLLTDTSSFDNVV